jgi:hypothetical protein
LLYCFLLSFVEYSIHFPRFRFRHLDPHSSHQPTPNSPSCLLCLSKIVCFSFVFRVLCLTFMFSGASFVFVDFRFW